LHVNVSSIRNNFNYGKHIRINRISGPAISLEA
jgi:hypothetical protein